MVYESVVLYVSLCTYEMDSVDRKLYEVDQKRKCCLFSAFCKLPYFLVLLCAVITLHVYIFVTQGSFVPLEIVSLLVAAAVHDVDHPGRTNDFLKTTGETY